MWPNGPCWATFPQVQIICPLFTNVCRFIQFMPYTRISAAKPPPQQDRGNQVRSSVVFG